MGSEPLKPQRPQVEVHPVYHECLKILKAQTDNYSGKLDQLTAEFLLDEIDLVTGRKPDYEVAKVVFATVRKAVVEPRGSEYVLKLYPFLDAPWHSVIYIIMTRADLTALNAEALAFALPILRINLREAALKNISRHQPGS